MTAESIDALDQLSQLERKISQAAEYVKRLRAERDTLRLDKIELKKEIDELKQSNIELSKQINDLKISEEHSSDSFDKEEVRKKIDHVLEKFSELQL